jgi:tetratricopeptide (TPR) repeat protein
MILLLICGQFELAESLYQYKYYDLAAVEYQRAFFFEPDSSRRCPRPRLNLAIARLMTDETGGLDALNAWAVDFPDSAPAVPRVLAGYYLKTQNYPAAEKYAADAGDRDLLGFLYLKDGRLTEARELFRDGSDSARTAAVADFLRQPGRSPITASVMSLLCPGAGEIYGGNLRLGVTDFLLNLGSACLLYNALRQKEFVDAGLVIGFLVNRFYFGSARNAQEAAERYNERKFQRWLVKFEAEYYPGTENSK